MEVSLASVMRRAHSRLQTLPGRHGSVTLLGGIHRGTFDIMPDARFASLTPLFAPRSVAVLGASSDPTRISGRPLAYMKAQGYQGALYPINPNRSEVQGLKAYPSVAALPETPDVAIVAIAAEIAEQAITELAERGVKAAVMFTAGFAEMDAAGEAAQQRMVAVAR